jgi:mRNA interferase RelE/StbE
VTAERYEIRFQAAARRAIAERLPESVAAAVLEFCDAALALSPRRVGKPLFGPLAGCHGARRGTYRVVYRIDEQARVVEVLDVDHRADIYHRPLSHTCSRSGCPGLRWSAGCRWSPVPSRLDLEARPGAYEERHHGAVPDDRELHTYRSGRVIRYLILRYPLIRYRSFC